MRRDMNVKTSRTRAGVLLRPVDGRPTVDQPKDRLTTWARLVGIDSDEALAEALGVTTRTIRRARNGVIGEKLMANSILAFRRYERELANHGIRPSLDELYVVVEKPTEMAA